MSGMEIALAVLLLVVGALLKWFFDWVKDRPGVRRQAREDRKSDTAAAQSELGDLAVAFRRPAGPTQEQLENLSERLSKVEADAPEKVQPWLVAVVGRVDSYGADRCSASDVSKAVETAREKIRLFRDEG
ncbi:hypothetical protein AB0Q95_35400 [Streptomyces sp. NPDC059900]|uniref:hypothetical protein n=1 Tax=Streptomyces sp. NPDC059900 TaxID=3155816 RepID=UPI003440AD63